MISKRRFDCQAERNGERCEQEKLFPPRFFGYILFEQWQKGVPCWFCKGEYGGAGMNRRSLIGKTCLQPFMMPSLASARNRLQDAV